MRELLQASYAGKLKRLKKKLEKLAQRLPIYVPNIGCFPIMLHSKRLPEECVVSECMLGLGRGGRDSGLLLLGIP